MRGSRLVAAVSLGAGLVTLSCAARHPDLHEFVQSAGPRRLVEPRLTGGFTYSPCRRPATAAELVPEARCAALPVVGSWRYHQLARIVTALKNAADRQPSAENLRAYAVAVLVDRESHLDRAIAGLERAVEEAPGRADLLSDLAAAYLLRAERRGEPYDLILALVVADRAVASDAMLAEARFNRALILDTLFLATAARSAWQDYLAVDSTSDWAAEARVHIAALDRQLRESTVMEESPSLARLTDKSPPATVDRIVKDNPQAARMYAEIRLLGGWAERLGQGQEAAAAATLSVARQIGLALAQLTGERMLQDAVARIDAAVTAHDPRLAGLLAGHRDFRDGYLLYKSRKALAAATAKLAAARTALAAAGSPFAAQAEFFLACCVFYDKRYADALDCLGRLWQQLEPGRYFSLRGHVVWMTAFTRFVIGDPAAAIPLYRQAESLFERGGERENMDFMRTLLAESLTELGRRREAWQQIYRSLKTTPGGHDLGRLYSAFVVPANAALKQGQTAVALYFQQEVVRYAERSGDPMRLPVAYLSRGSIQAVLGRPEAQTDLQRARRALEGQPDATLRGLTQANLDRTEGEIVRDPRQAIALLSSALGFYERAQLHILALQIYRARARAYLRAGDSKRAEEDLRSGLDAYERIGHFVSDTELQVTFVEEMEAVFDEAISFEIEQRRRADLAFDLADRARTHVLPAYASKITADTPEKTRLLASEPAALKLAEIQGRLPAGTALVEYAVVGDRIDFWLIRRDSWRWWQREIPRRDLQKQVAALRTFRPDRAGRSRWSRTSAALYDLLVRPWAAAVAPGERLVLVPDKVLHALPFACLREGPNGPYLIEAHPLTIAPSGTIFARALTQGSRQPRTESARRALVVGNPTFDTSLSSFSQLGPLAEAEEEAKSVGFQLGGATLLLGPEARKARFLALAPGMRILHFGGHAVVDESNPLLSALLLAPDPGDLGILYAREVYTMRLRGTELVVLAACSTGIDYLPGSEGVTSLGRAFLAAGARNVVASLWSVDDRTTRQLLQAFYRSLLAGADPASALRSAQLSLLRDPQAPAADPSAWGAFEVIGAGPALPTSLF